MITKQQFETGIRCKGMCEYGNGGCSDRFACYQYQVAYPKTSDVLWKEVIYKGEIYHCYISIENKTIVVNDKDDNNLFNLASPLENLIDECKSAVKEAYERTIKQTPNQYKLFADWDGNMDIDE